MARYPTHICHLPIRLVTIAGVFILTVAAYILLAVDIDIDSSKSRLRNWSSGTGSSTKDPILHLVLPLNKAAHGARSCMVFASALVNGYNPLVINWDDDHGGNAGMRQIAKVHGMLDFLHRDDSSFFKTDDDLVMMVDAFDAWFQLPPSAIISRYREVGKDIVVGVDMGCWPNWKETPACTDVPESTLPMGTFGMKDGKEIISRPKHANSGLVMAPRARLRQFYEEIDHAFELPRSDIAISDQGPFNDFLHEGKLALDYSYRLIWNNAWNIDSGIPMNVGNPAVAGLDPTKPDTNLIPWHLLPTLIWHSHTGEIPVIVHFNQYNAKGMMEEWWEAGKPWYASKDSRFSRRVVERLSSEDAVITMVHDGSKHRFFDLCPPTMLDLPIVEDGTGL